MELTQGWVILSPALSAQRGRDTRNLCINRARSGLRGCRWVTGGSTRTFLFCDVPRNVKYLP
jgi:hypothetical protein